jgi:hypothetical protein
LRYGNSRFLEQLWPYFGILPYIAFTTKIHFRYF